MARIEKTVFISYRRTDVYTALAVYENLKNQGYDVFFDYTSISSGDFEQIITSNIKARAHFLLILTPTALDRCNEPGDWLRREIELAIDEKRNIVPLFFKGFGFGSPSVSDKLTDKLKNLNRYNGLNVHEDYFEEAMQRVRTQFLSKPLDTVLHPVSIEVRKVVKEEQVAADEALKHKEQIKLREEKPLRKKELPKARAEQPVNSILAKPFPYRLMASLAGGLAVLILGIWGGISLWNNLPSSIPEPTWTSQPTATKTIKPVITDASPPTKTSIPPAVNILITVQPTPILRVVNAFAGGGGANIREVPNGKILAVVLNGTVITVIPDETQNVNGVLWVQVIALVNGVRVEGWMDGSVLINTVTPP